MSAEKAFLLAILVLPGLFSSALAQQAQKTAETFPVLVNVADQHGSLVRDLTKDSFRVRINRTPAVISDARYSAAPRRVVVVLDMSGSMGPDEKTGKWQVALEIVNAFLTQTRLDTPIAMVVFSGQVDQFFDFRPGRAAAIAQWLNSPRQTNIKSESGTALYDAIVAGLKLLDPPQLGDTVYAITDGGDNHSHNSQAYAKDALLKSRARLFAFFFDEDRSSIEGQEATESFLKMVSDSGGIAVSILGRQASSPPLYFHYDYGQRSKEKLKILAQELGSQIEGFWILQVSAAVQSKNSKVKLEIVDQKGKARKDLALSYARMLAPSK